MKESISATLHSSCTSPGVETMCPAKESPEGHEACWVGWSLGKMMRLGKWVRTVGKWVMEGKDAA